jgi:Fe-S-cluster containining protein
MGPFEQYYKLVARIDKDANRLTGIHGDAITCRPGCTSCCVNLTVFPVEFHAIRRAMEQAGEKPGGADFDPTATCGFLHDGRCRIYPFRPIICRTHGLPILFLDDTSGEYTWEVSFCERNFTGFEQIEFTHDTLLNIEEINEELSRLNQEFLEMQNLDENARLTRIPLEGLCQGNRI